MCLGVLHASWQGRADRFIHSIFAMLLSASGTSLVLGLNLSFEFCWGSWFCPDPSPLHLCICHPFPHPF